jgi:hypothetical protein
VEDVDDPNDSRVFDSNLVPELSNTPSDSLLTISPNSGKHFNHLISEFLYRSQSTLLRFTLKGSVVKEAKLLIIGSYLEFSFPKRKFHTMCP